MHAVASRTPYAVCGLGMHPCRLAGNMHASLQACIPAGLQAPCMHACRRLVACRVASTGSGGHVAMRGCALWLIADAPRPHCRLSGLS